MQRCKFCGSEMDLMEENIGYLNYICLNEKCNYSLTIRENYDEDEWEKVE